MSTLRPSLRTRPLVTAVAVLITASLAAAVWISTREIQAQRGIYADTLEQQLDTTEREFRLLLRPFGRGLDTLAAWQEQAVLPLDDPAALARLVVPVFDPAPQVAVVAFASADGKTTLLVRGSDSWSTLSGEALAGGGDWIASAIDSTTLSWTDSAQLPGDGRPGLLATRRVGSLVLGLGLRESDLDAFTAAATLTANGILLRRYDDGAVAWLTPRFGNRLAVIAAADLMTSALPEHVVIGTALRTWGEAGRPYHQTFRFRIDRTDWWAVFYPQAAGTDPGELGLIAPTGDLENRLAKVTDRVTWLLIGVAVLAMVVVVVQAFGYRNRWHRVAYRRLELPTDEAALAALIAGGEGGRLEFKSTMRWNLHADKPGKEIELAWLKSVVAYLNTDGGFIVLGLRDDGSLLGIEADRIASDDKYRLHFENLIAQHVGLEFAGHIRGDFHTLADGRVFLVAVERCADPAFLRRDDDEEFYVRVGPSSRKLPASRVLDWHKERPA